MSKAIEMSVRLDRVLVDQIAGRWHLLILAIQCFEALRSRHLPEDSYPVSAPA